RFAGYRWHRGGDSEACPAIGRASCGRGVRRGADFFEWTQQTAWHRRVFTNAVRQVAEARRQVGSYVFFVARWRTTSKRTIPAATLTFSERIGPVVGIETRKSQRFFTRSCR